MTYGVPYSFVPGTKAKADEVNANFIDVLNKIEQTNSSIETVNSEKLNLDLSNLNAEGQGIIDAKANITDLDGKWTSKSSYVAQSITLSSSFDKTYNLSSILPNDGNVYEVIICAMLRTSSSNNNTLALSVASSLCSITYLCRAVTRTANANQIASGSCIIPIGLDRSIRFCVGDETNASSYANSCSFKISAYRKVK